MSTEGFVTTVHPGDHLVLMLSDHLTGKQIDLLHQGLGARLPDDVKLTLIEGVSGAVVVRERSDAAVLREQIAQEIERIDLSSLRYDNPSDGATALEEALAIVRGES